LNPQVIGELQGRNPGSVQHDSLVENHPVSDKPITLLLSELSRGDKKAMDRLMPLLYKELRRIADGYLRNERSGHTLQPTALVNELYVRLMGQNQPDYRDRAHFLGVAATVMRQILIDHARTKGAAKRGGAQANLPLNEALDAGVSRPSSIIEVDDALRELERRDELQSKLIEFRFFGGLTAEESAEALQLPVQTVRRELRLAQAWLQSELDRSATS